MQKSFCAMAKPLDSSGFMHSNSRTTRIRGGVRATVRGAFDERTRTMPRSRTMMVTGLLLVVGFMGGCKNSLKEENAMLKQENADLTAQLADRNHALESLSAEKRSLEQQLALSRKDGVDMAGMKNEDGVTWTQGAGEVTASIEGDVLFDSGKTTLKSSAKKSLDNVAGVINGQYGGKTLRVSGYTDTDPIKKSGYKSNYHLGFERAYAVREYLISKGVSAKHISLASYGPDVPKSSKPQSRRVEVSVIMN
jgi:outer membrane protein OmpA-like peptidoglycan-associated protein